ncbi:unnamed protein product [Acanthoscelides obtectus]|uniref:Transmembrane protein 26 n=1 Tax=Acanthoscelides obtectus TaxID=200917 RepID=A0A9P0Q9P0_ACAOB|nr:unnamed protein product [Acanthoscelides obtectus]CAK1680391.1 Transmembrane protein 26 [Acanthoscelides obtectus]
MFYFDKNAEKTTGQKRFCPSVFLYLTSIVPAIWLLELDKVDRRMKAIGEIPLNLTTGSQLKDFNDLIGVQIKLPDISLTTETWITLIEQFLMLILIIGRWMLPKGDLTRDQLSQLLLVYIGTAADIIEFFDSFKDDKIASEPILVLLTLGIWSWSLMQFTVVLTATKARRSRLTTTKPSIKRSDNCCTIDVCSIVLNITLQDAPFLAFRLLLITHFKIISYMNVFFTCKNTLVILLQMYRLYVVYSEHNKKVDDHEQLTNISIISKDIGYNRRPRRPSTRAYRSSVRRSREEVNYSSESDGDRSKQKRQSKASRKDTGYSTESSHASLRKQNRSKNRRSGDRSRSREYLDEEENRRDSKQRLRRSDGDTKGRRKMEDAFPEESDQDQEEATIVRKQKKTRGSNEKKYQNADSSDPSTE